MILAFSPEQAHEVAQAFDIPSAVDSSWWLNNEMLFPNQDKAKASERVNQGETNSPASSAPAADAKPAPNDSTEKPKTRPTRCCPAMHRNPTFQPCHRFHQATRCHMNKNTRVIEQRNPIHMHQETNDAAKMSLDVTGFAPEDISIHIEDYIVSIQGKRTNKLGDVFVVNRRFRLDKKTASIDEVTANFDEGILELTVPKKSMAGPRKIPIVVSSSVADSCTEEESIEEEEPLGSSSHKESDDVDDVDEPSNNEEPQSTEDNNKEEDEKQQNTITVETVNEGNAAIEDDEEQESTANQDKITNKPSEEEETWEEVSK